MLALAMETPYLWLLVSPVWTYIRFSDIHGFEKPNDARGLDLMNAAARNVMEAYPDVALAFGESDEYR
jgi:tRNA(His) guanylyltransferase